MIVEETQEAKNYEKAQKDYGSTENFNEFLELEESDTPSRRAYISLQSSINTEDEILEAMDIAPPYFMDPVQLRELPLYLIGVPDGSLAHNKATNYPSDRNKRRPRYEGGAKPELLWADFTEMGWPSSMGNPRRAGSPEEFEEIERRLKGTSLTRPGSEVSVTGQSLASLFEENVPEPAWIIEGLLRIGGALIVYGQAGLGKSWLVHTLMVMASYGRGVSITDDETGIQVLKAGDHKDFKVALVDGEMIKADILSRCRTVRGSLGLTPASSFAPPLPMEPHRLRLAMKGEDPADIEAWVEALCGTGEGEGEHRVSLPGMGSAACIDLSQIELKLKTDQHAKAVFPDLADPEWKTQIIEFARKEALKVIVFDNLSTLCPSLEDENKAIAWAPFNDLVVALKHIGVATIVVHHSGKGGSYRGSTNIMTTLENSMKLTPVEGGDGAYKEARFKVELEKKRGLAHALIDGKVLRLSEGKWQVELDEQGASEQVFKLIRSCRYTKQTEVAQAAGMSQTTICRLLQRANVMETMTKAEVTSCFRKARQLLKPDFELDYGEVDLDI